MMSSEYSVTDLLLALFHYAPKDKNLIRYDPNELHKFFGRHQEKESKYEDLVAKIDIGWKEGKCISKSLDNAMIMLVGSKCLYWNFDKKYYQIHEEEVSHKFCGLPESRFTSEQLIQLRNFAKEFYNHFEVF